MSKLYESVGNIKEFLSFILIFTNFHLKFHRYQLSKLGLLPEFHNIKLEAKISKLVNSILILILIY
jgi:hypothetical protein